MESKPTLQRDEPSPGLLLRGYLGLALALGGLAVGDDLGRGMLIIGTLVIGTGVALFAIEGLVRWKNGQG